MKINNLAAVRKVAFMVGFGFTMGKVTAEVILHTVSKVLLKACDEIEKVASEQDVEEEK